MLGVALAELLRSHAAGHRTSWERAESEPNHVSVMAALVGNRGLKHLVDVVVQEGWGRRPISAGR